MTHRLRAQIDESKNPSSKRARTQRSEIRGDDRESQASIRARHAADDARPGRIRFSSVEAMRGMVVDATLTLRHDVSVASIAEFQAEAEGLVHTFLRSQIRRNRQIKFRIIMQVELHRMTQRGMIVTDNDVYLSSTTIPIYQASDIAGAIDEAFERIQNELDNFNRNGSGWVIHRVIRCVIHADQWQAIRGGRPGRGGGTWFKLPNWLAKSRSIINIKNKDHYCFKYCMEAGYSRPMQDADRVTHYIRRHTFTYELNPSHRCYLPFPFNGHTNVFEHFEQLNQHLHIQIYAFEASDSAKRWEDIIVIYSSRLPTHPNTKKIYLLLVEDPVQRGNKHWVLISNKSRLFQLAAGNKIDICDRCLLRMPFHKLKEHELLCKNVGEVKVSYPHVDNAFVSFRNYRKKIPAPFIIYADFECILCDKNIDLVSTDPQLEQDESIINVHVPNAYAFKRVCNFDQQYNAPLQLYSTTEENIYYDAKGLAVSDVGEHFIETLRIERHKIFEIIKKVLIEGRDLIMNEEAERKFQEATHCHICTLPFSNGHLPQWENAAVDRVKVRDHDHFNLSKETNYRGAAHAWCNLQFHVGFVIRGENTSQEEVAAEEQYNSPGQIKFNCRRFQIPVVFHNLRGYDGHIILRAIKSNNIVTNIVSIPNDGEKFMSFSFNNMKFIDSFQFLADSLESLTVNMLKDGSRNFVYLKSEFDSICARFSVEPTLARFELLLKKGQYPYEYMDSFQRFSEITLPPIEKFFSKLTNSSITAAEYAHAQLVWESFNIQTLQDYHDLYLITDVMLLTDIFQRFRNVAMVDCPLDPIHYVSLPGYSLDACLYQCQQMNFPATLTLPQRTEPFRVEVFSDCSTQKDMHLFCESAVRGGISMIPNRYAKANHKYLNKCIQNQTKIFLLYLDANNLYGWAMTQAMPIGSYSWVIPTNFPSISDIMNWHDFGEFGYLLEVDLHIPPHLHSFFRDYPLAPENQPVLAADISPFMANMRARCNIKHDDTKKLLCTLKDKTKYIVHYRNLKLYIELGYQLKKIHRILKFKQAKWISSYIEYNTAKRAVAKTKIEKDIPKLKNNSVFGKMLQNDRKHRKAEICVNESKLRKELSNPFFDDRRIVNSDTTITYSRPRKLVLNKPIIVGVCILELSKLLMYQFYYKTLKPIFSTRMNLCLTDTDSLILKIQSKDVYKEIKDNHIETQFDFSNYPKDHFLYDPTTEAKIGLFKDEMAPSQLLEFVGLRSKMYSVLGDRRELCWHPPMKLLDPPVNKKVAKGVKRYIIKTLSHDNYKECLFNQLYNPNEHKVNMVGFKTIQHNIYTTQVKKCTLSPADDKLYQIDGFATQPYGFISSSNQSH